VSTLNKKRKKPEFDFTLFHKPDQSPAQDGLNFAATICKKRKLNAESVKPKISACDDIKASEKKSEPLSKILPFMSEGSKNLFALGTKPII
jgi:hypothetical protein